ncbi:MAG: NAD(P)-binding domain-containing protein [Archangium sp.]|nr:NAD(P)-binding domain-containing protein [Archangium sp.]
MSLDLLLLGVLLAIGAGLAYFMTRRRALREAADTEALAQVEKEGRAEAPTLHPVIDPDRCIGSLSCTAVCPEGDILGVVDGKAALINPSACIGHGKCAVECPVDAIQLVFGSAKRGLDLPETDEFFESSRKGVHIVGELGGMGLIKNAITQGLQVARHLGPKLIGSQSPDMDDVVVVGAGPSGLATALGLAEQKLNFAVLEQESLGGTIAHYPRQKVVMTERIDLPYFGKFGAPLISKEQLLESWEQAVAKAKIQINTGTKVEKIDGHDGDFTVHTSKGPVRAKKVVLAIGRRGSPRKMGVPGEELPKVAYRLIDAQQYEGARVLIVGGGDAALEAAIQIAEESDAEVALSYRQPEFGKAREANKRRFKELVEEGRVFAFMASNIKKVSPESVTLDNKGKLLELPNDFVIACLGGEVPTEFLTKMGVGMTTLKGESLGAKARRGSAKQEAQEKSHRRLSFGLFVLGALIVATLFVVGADYYRLSPPERLAHVGHKFLKPAGTWGHGVGIVATLVMMSNFLYAVRKRWERLKGFSTIRTWLTFHQFVGFLSPLVIVFHAAFQSKNQLATLTAMAMTVVVVTGIIGRFIYGLVPSGQGKPGELHELSKRWHRLSERLGQAAANLTSPDKLADLVASAVSPAQQASLGQYLAQMPRQRLADARDLSRARSLFQSPAQAREFADSFKRLRKLQVQVSFFRSLKMLLSAWRVFHVVLAILLVILIAAHIGLSLFLGYRWIFT